MKKEAISINVNDLKKKNSNMLLKQNKTENKIWLDVDKRAKTLLYHLSF